MNRIYRTVFNRALGVWQVVAEIASAQGKGRSAGRGGRRAPHLLALLPLSVWASLASAASPSATSAADGLRGGASAQAPRVSTTTLPSGGTVSAGSGSIGQNGAAMTIIQNSQNLAINWQTFDIGRDASVTFLQPNATAIALNRVLGSDPSQVLGQLKGNGQVWVINPNGVLFGNTAQVSVGGLMASTLGLSDGDFMAGKRSFSGSGGSVVNQGNLSGGYVALLGESVRNEGVIAARLGTAALAAGNTVTLDFNGDQLLNVQVDEGALRALADNRGLIQADGGSVLMTARAKDALLDTAVNNTGVIRARTVESRNGRILLIGDMHSGTANIAGTLDASAPDGGNGGFIETSAAHVKVADSAVITTRATSGSNGRWLIDPVDFTVAASGGDMTGAALTNALANGDVEIQSTTGASGVNGDVNIRDTVNWSQNTLTLNAQRDISVFNTMNAGGTAGLFFKFNQADAGGTYNIYAPVNLASTGSFRTQSGSAGAVTNWTIITSLGSETDVTGNTGTTLQGIWGNLGGNFVLGADINASATAGWNGGLGFTPIGGNDPGASSNPGFTGNFDGLGHVIDGLTINTPNNNIGLFGSAFSASIANIGLTHASITGQFSVGGLAGRSGNLHIHNSYVSGAITGATAVGGLVGNDIYPRGTNVLEHVWTAGSVTATAASTGTGSLVGIAGGLVGDNAGAIRNSYSTADVRGGNHVGGLAGRIFSDIDKSYFAGTVGSNGVAGGDGTVKAPYALGALVGQMTGSGTVSNSFWNTDTAGAVGVGRIEYTGVFNGVGLTTAQMRNAANWVGFDFVTTPSQNGWVLLDGVLPMLASEWSPVIHTAHQLQLMALDLSARYTLAGDIDASATNGKDVWYGGSFSPIGNTTTRFTGSFDGQNHTIDSLTINRATQSYIGLFGYVDGASLAHVILQGASITGGGYGVGALAGFVGADSTVDHVQASGTVSGTNTRVGGLVGRNEGRISNSSANVVVSGEDDVGGLVGGSSGAISNSTAAGKVTNTDLGNGRYTGGLVGRIMGNGTISSSSATGNVSGVEYVGGLVGHADAAITNSTASGAVTGGADFVGGLAGYTTSRGMVADSGASGEVKGHDRIGGLVGEAHAVITGSHATGDVTGSGSYVGGLVGATDAAITDSHANGMALGVSYVGGLAGWTNAAIQSSYATGAATGSGSFVGGLAGQVIASITESYAEGDVRGNDSVGGLVGESAGTVSKSHAAGDVTLSGNGAYAGGLLGQNVGGSVTQSYATGDVVATSSGNSVLSVGGLVGRNTGGITQSYATGNVTGTRTVAGSSNVNVGGLVGLNASFAGNIDNSYATGNVHGIGKAGIDMAVGGVVGLNASFGGSITRTYAIGQVSGAMAGNLYLGGVLGWQGLNNTNPLAASFFATTDAGGNPINSGLGVIGYDPSGNGNSGSSGKTLAELQQLSTFTSAGWGMDDQGGTGSIWRIYEGSTMPLLRSFMRQLTVTAPVGGADKTYDGQIASGTLSGYTTSTPANASLLLGALGYATTGANAGTYSTANGTLQLGGLHSAQQGYDISYAGASSLTINKAALTVTANNAGKTYDATAWSGGNGVSYSGFVNGENEAVLGGTLAYGGSSQGAVNAGNYLISASGLSSGNYAISYVDGILTIDPRTLGIVVNLTGTVRKTYDGTAAAVLDASNFLVTGWVDGDGATITATRGLYEDANAGTGKRVTVDLTSADYLADAGTNLANYVLPMQVNGNVGVIDKAAATVTAHSATVTYNGQTQGVNGYTVTGLVNGEDESVLDNLVETGGNGRNTGTYAHGFSGSDNNYALTFIDGTLTIGKAKLTVGSSDVTRTYDGTTSAAGTAIVLGGRLFGDDAISGGNFAFTDKNAGTGKTVTVGGVTVDDGNGGDNYDVTYSSNTNSTILQKTVTIGGGFDAQDKLHDGSDRATIGRNALALQGAIAGDALTVDWQAAFADAAKGVNKTVTLRGTALAGGDSANYLLDLAGAPTAVASIVLSPIETHGARYVGAFDSAVARHGTHPSPVRIGSALGIVLQQCGINLPDALVRNCE